MEKVDVRESEIPVFKGEAVNWIFTKDFLPEMGNKLCIVKTLPGENCLFVGKYMYTYEICFFNDLNKRFYLGQEPVDVVCWTSIKEVDWERIEKEE